MLPMDSTHQLPVTSSPPVETAEVPLDRLPQSCCGVIRRIEVAAADMDRLKTMGVCVGRRVQVVKSGDPMILRIMDTRIGLAARLATFVYVSPGSNA